MKFIAQYLPVMFLCVPPLLDVPTFRFSFSATRRTSWRRLSIASVDRSIFSYLYSPGNGASFSKSKLYLLVSLCCSTFISLRATRIDSWWSGTPNKQRWGPAVFFNKPDGLLTGSTRRKVILVGSALRTSMVGMMVREVRRLEYPRVASCNPLTLTAWTLGVMRSLCCTNRWAYRILGRWALLALIKDFGSQIWERVCDVIGS